MAHTCHHHRAHDIMLTLPDCEGWYERCLSYRCDGCGDTADLSGSFNLRSAPFTFQDLLQQLATERRQGTALAQVAQREDAVRRRERRRG